MTYDEFKLVMKFLSGSTGPSEKPLSEDTMNVYWLCLQDLPFESAKVAVLDHLSNNNWFPKIAEIRRGVLEAMPHERVPSAAEAWQEVVKNFDHPGRYGEPQFSHSAIKRAVEAFGWVTMCNSENADVLRGEFAKLYGQLAQRIERNLLELPAVTEIKQQLASGEKLIELPEKIRRLADAKRIG